MDRRTTTERKGVGFEGQSPFAYQALIQEPKKKTLRRIVPCVSPEKKALVLDNFYMKGWRIPKIKRVLDLRYDVVEQILRAVYLEVTPEPPSNGNMRRVA